MQFTFFNKGNILWNHLGLYLNLYLNLLKSIYGLKVVGRSGILHMEAWFFSTKLDSLGSSDFKVKVILKNWLINAYV